MELIIEAHDKHMDDLLEMSMDLWPDEEREIFYKLFKNILNTSNNKVLLYVINGERVGFIYLSVRVDYVEGSEFSPTGYLEGIYIKPDFRKKGIARKLLVEGEKWLKEKNCKEIGSDIYLDNKVSYDFHSNAGFKETARLITFIKDIK